MIINKFNLHHEASKIVVIYNGINIQTKNTIFQNLVNKKNKIFKVGFIGRIETQNLFIP